MSSGSLTAVILPALVLPPGISVALLVIAVLYKRPYGRLMFLLLGLASLYLSSTLAVSDWLRSRLEIYPTVAVDRIAAQAIVVLGAGRSRGAPEYGGDTMTPLGLERLRYAALLQKKTGLPILVSGGSVFDEPVSEGELMREALREFGVETRWLEGNSRNTYENAVFSSRLLKDVGVDSIVLVTHAWHMPRAVKAFERAGMVVTPAPMGSLEMFPEGDYRDWLPTASGLQMSFLALHEMLGRVWYDYRYYRSTPASQPARGKIE